MYGVEAFNLALFKASLYIWTKCPSRLAWPEPMDAPDSWPHATDASNLKATWQYRLTRSSRKGGLGLTDLEMHASIALYPALLLTDRIPEWVDTRAFKEHSVITSVMPITSGDISNPKHVDGDYQFWQSRSPCPMAHSQMQNLITLLMLILTGWTVKFAVMEMG
ncbi:predicted protein [Histoplasma capsulatum var. duboisii H88]|uniref:Predicted protein n=2 Tax=Ajellomyces capsulatus TaxID=5037 RepID=F0UF01_AJEC8|nr:predicted protein [Histoplasma capsulatum H143]EGC44858.1 predicted protein [Histoplasma capsulatum var. duboisii H88]